MSPTVPNPDRAELLRDENPPPIRTNRGKAILLGSAGVILAGLMLIVVLNIDRAQNKPKSPTVSRNPTELVNPEILSKDDLNSANLDLKRTTDIGTGGGWIEQIDKQTGRLKQQLHYDHSEPLPAGVMHFDGPQVRMFLSGNRMVYLTGDSARIKAPEQSLDEGRVTGHVVIRVFKIPDDGGPVDVNAATPLAMITTHEAEFNNFQGEIRCDGRVEMQTPTAFQRGTGLRLLINDKLNRPEWLRIEQVEFVKLASLPEQGLSAELSGPATSRPAKAEPVSAWVATGDELGVVFSMNSSSLGADLGSSGDKQADQAAATRPNRAKAREQFYRLQFLQSVRVVQGRQPGESAPVATAQPATAADESQAVARLYQPTDKEITITCAGGLTMTPLKPEEPTPSSQDDTVLELIGSPATVLNQADQSRMTCQRLQYATLDERLDLFGSSEQLIRVNTPEFRAEGLRFWLDRKAKQAQFIDQGWMESTNAAAAMVGPATKPEANQVPRADEPLRIAWSRQVDLKFHEVETPAKTDSAKPGAKLRLDNARFLGDIDVTSADFSLKSEVLAVTFSTQLQDRQVLSNILASDSVLVHSKRDKGMLACNSLDIILAQSRDQRTIPVEMTATGDVAAVDDSQVVWADILIAKFADSTPAETGSPESARPRNPYGRNGVELVGVLADRNVQIRMNDGTRAFADQMTGDPINGTVVLTSQIEVAIASQEMLIDQGKRLELNREQQTAYWPGAGRARMFHNPVIADALALQSAEVSDIQYSRIERPVVDESVNPMQVRATWTESMSYDNAANADGGALEIVGNVDAISQPTALQYSTITSQSLRLEFAKTAENAAANPAPAANSPQAMMQGKRHLNLMTAKGNAALENRTWLKDDHSDVPRVFQVVGDTVWYNNLTLEAGVPSPGHLLVRDERPQVAPDADAAPKNGQSPLATFNASGATAFKWSGELHMTRVPGNDSRFHIDMTKDVEILHKDLNGLATTVTGQTLQATVDRTATDAPKGPAMDLGGSMELVGIRGDGGVYIHTPQRDVSTDSFVYDVLTQIANLSAVDNRFVSVITPGSPNVMRAQRMTWDMAKDVITIEGGVGDGESVNHRMQSRDQWSRRHAFNEVITC